MNKTEMRMMERTRNRVLRSRISAFVEAHNEAYKKTRDNQTKKITEARLAAVLKNPKKFIKASQGHVSVDYSHFEDMPGCKSLPEKAQVTVSFPVFDEYGQGMAAYVYGDSVKFQILARKMEERILLDDQSGLIEILNSFEQ